MICSDADGNYYGEDVNYIVSERCCAYYIRETIKAEGECIERKNKKRAFIKANPIRYIDLVDE
jgi:hypothetical protein